MTFSASAPGRAGIIGNPSDIYGGTVVSCSIPVRNRCTITLGQDGPFPEDPRLWDAAFGRLPVPEPLGVSWECEVPRSSGLSGSTALLAATIAALKAARGEGVEPDSALAELVRDIERHDADIVCGYQDAYMIVHGGLRRMRFAGKHPVNAGPHATIESLAAPLPFLLITTGVERLSGSVHGPMAQRWLNGDQDVIDKMLRAAELGELGAEKLLAGDWAGLGTLMNENQAITASLGGSGDDIDRLIGSCLRHGALGAKLAGAGMGGTVICLVDDDLALEHTLRTEGYSRFLRPCAGPGLRLELN
jgi:galactokinase/mevalonate kinase-like predicted kinase